MDTIHCIQLFHDSCHAYTVETMLEGMLFICLDNDALLLFVEAQDIHDHPRATGQLF